MACWYWGLPSQRNNDRSGIVKSDGTPMRPIERASGSRRQGPSSPPATQARVADRGSLERSVIGSRCIFPDRWISKVRSSWGVPGPGGILRRGLMDTQRSSEPSCPYLAVRHSLGRRKLCRIRVMRSYIQCLFAPVLHNRLLPCTVCSGSPFPLETVGCKTSEP